MTQKKTTEGPKPFTTTLALVDNGRAVHEAAERFHELLTTMREVAEAKGEKVKGRMTFSLAATLHKGAMDVDYDITIKAPTPKRESTLLFLDKNNNVTTEMTRQEKLPLRDVSSPEVRGSEQSTKEV